MRLRVKHMNNLEKWKFISRTTLLDHPRLQIVEDTVQLPNGVMTQYLRHLPAAHHSVAVIAVNEELQILLQQEYSYPPDEILWQLPGGSIVNQEAPEEAALRELSEESGYTADYAQILGFFYTNNRRSDEKQFVVVCKNLRPQKLDADPEEFIRSRWYSVTDVLKMIQNGTIHNMNLLAALQLWMQSDVNPESKKLR